MDKQQIFNWVTPSELIDLYPVIKNLYYTPQRIGYLAMAGAVSFKKRGRITFIDKSSFIEFFKWRYQITL